jgi:hypothetical protein
MKLETLLIITKGAVVCGSAFVSALVGSLAQWSNEPTEPTNIQWFIILGTALGAGLSALGGFLSTAFGKYLVARNGFDRSAKPPDLLKP